MACDGANLDVTFSLPISFTQSIGPMLFCGDVSAAGGYFTTQNVRSYSLAHIERETNYANVGGWWLAMGR